jgi:hypothetical protein
MLDDAARIKMCELDRDTPDKMPCAASAGEKIGHRFRKVLDVLLDEFWR